ncbi:hypothetical protein GGS24DRAFT_450206 [Hypoxylon argillaceum]|nr:hypothetical protein GGS24DRAFT_450206 [Hypoxylon argillaceum]
MSVAGNVVIATLVLFLTIGIGFTLWRAKKFVAVFANQMFTGKQAELEHQQQSPQRRQRATGPGDTV